MNFTRLWAVFSLACAVAAFCCCGSIAKGEQLTVLNPSFEDLTGPPNSQDFDSNGNLRVGSWTDIGPSGLAFQANSVPSWTVTGNDAGTVNPYVAEYPNGVPDGQNVAFIGGTTGGGTISQTLAATLAVGTYTLLVDVGNPGVIFFAGYGVQLFAGSTLLAEDNNTLSPARVPSAPRSWHITPRQATPPSVCL